MRIGLYQCEPRPTQVAANLDRLSEAANEAGSRGADLLVCPEMFLTGYNIGGDAVAGLAEPRDGPAAGAVAEIARATGVAIVYGYPELAAGEIVFNAVQLVDADGIAVANYRKTHLFGELDRSQFSASDVAPSVVQLGGWRIGLLICYDVEFPENVRAHALAGTDLLGVPTAQMHPFEFVAESLVPTRAWESQLYVAYVNRHGAEGDFEFVGLSCLAGPDGIARARAGRGEELLLADADPEPLRASRAANPYLADRRPELY
jgi:predicted amidohydrolase